MDFVEITTYNEYIHNVTLKNNMYFDSFTTLLRSLHVDYKTANWLNTTIVNNDSTQLTFSNCLLDTLKSILEKNKRNKEYLYSLLEILINQLLIYNSYYEKKSVMYPYIDPNEIYIIYTNETCEYYVLFLPKYVFPLYNTNIYINYPIKRNNYFSPELSDVVVLPSTISSKSWYYSLGILIQETFHTYNIKHTPMYDIMYTCMNNDSSKRIILV